MSAPTELKAPATSGQLATFWLDGDLYGVDERARVIVELDKGKWKLAP